MQEGLPYDTQFFQQLVTPYLPKLKGYCIKVLGNQSDAEEAVQETIIKALTNLKGFKWLVSFQSWLFKIAHHECINKMRERRWDIMQYDDDYLDSLEAKQPEENDITTLISTMLESLSFDDRNIMLLRYRTGLDFQEIADICEMKLSAVKMRHKRILEFLTVHMNSD
ncbi:MAG: RNA polymerase sigma-70 factor (ECF subfamily) [Cognaticolwellia sp.]